MKYNKLSDLAIFVLVVAAVFQTGKLWLGNTESHNFFYSLYSGIGKEVDETNKNNLVIEPEKTVVGYGNRKFNMLYTDNESNSITKLSESVIKDVFLNGEFVSVSKINWEDYIDGKAVVLKYSFNISAREYMSGYGVNNKGFLENVAGINYVVVVPGSGSSDVTRCYFIDNSTSEACMFTLSGVDSPFLLYNAIQNMQYSDKDAIEYISTVQSGMNIFESIYVPQWLDGEYMYNTVKVINSFEDERGNIDREKLGACANGFFANYVSGEDASNVNDMYTFSNNNTIVKYYENGVLEYYNYDIGTTNTEQSISSAYTISKEFIKKDSFIKNDIYLSSVDKRNEGLVLCYDYALNDIPIRFSKTFSEEIGMEHAIEVVVSNDNVKRYKRYIASFEPDENMMAKINVDMISAWDDAIMKYTGTEEVTSVSDMSIGYLLDNKDEMFIKWFTSVNGSTIVGETYK